MSVILTFEYLGTHPCVYWISVPWATFGQRECAAAQFRHELAHFHDGDWVKRSRQSRQVLHVVHPARKYLVNTPLSGPVCRGRRVNRRGGAEDAMQPDALVFLNHPLPRLAAGRPSALSPTGSNTPNNGSWNNTPH